MKFKHTKISIIVVIIGLLMSNCAPAQLIGSTRNPITSFTPMATISNIHTALQETPLPTMPPLLAPDFRNVVPFSSSDRTRLLVRMPDGSLQIIELNEQVDPGFQWSAGGLGSSFGNTANGYVFELRPGYLAVLGASGEAAIPFFPSTYTEGLDSVQTKPTGIVVLAGKTPQTARLAWSVYGWSDDYVKFGQELFFVFPDGKNHTTLIAETAPGDFPYIEPLRWSHDGQKLYYDRMPDGLGGWMPFGGATGLYVFDLKEGVSHELIAPDRSLTPVCVGDLSRDERLTADNCNEAYEPAIRDLQTGRKIKIAGPAKGFNANENAVGTSAGGARFSPNAEKIAYGINLEPDDSHPTQSWVAVGDINSQDTQIIFTAQPGELISIIGWLNEDQLLFQREQNSGNDLWMNSLWTMHADGSELHPITQGTLLAILEP